MYGLCIEEHRSEIENNSVTYSSAIDGMSLYETTGPTGVRVASQNMQHVIRELRRLRTNASDFNPRA